MRPQDFLSKYQLCRQEEDCALSPARPGGSRTRGARSGRPAAGPGRCWLRGGQKQVCQKWEALQPYHRRHPGQAPIAPWCQPPARRPRPAPRAHTSSMDCTLHLGQSREKFFNEHRDRAADFPPRKLLRTMSKPNLSSTSPPSPPRPFKKSISSRTLPVHLCPPCGALLPAPRRPLLPAVRSDNLLISRLTPQCRAARPCGKENRSSQPRMIPAAPSPSRQSPRGGAQRGPPPAAASAASCDSFERIAQWLQECSAAMQDTSHTLQLPAISE